MSKERLRFLRAQTAEAMSDVAHHNAVDYRAFGEESTIHRIGVSSDMVRVAAMLKCIDSWCALNGVSFEDALKYAKT